MEFQRSSFSFRSSDYWVHMTLQGFQSPADSKSQFFGELSLRQNQIFQKRFHAFILDEFPLGHDLTPRVARSLTISLLFPQPRSCHLRITSPPDQTHGPEIGKPKPSWLHGHCG
ncbi:hypothetical protein FF1_009018 [Malus domestica]